MSTPDDLPRMDRRKALQWMLTATATPWHDAKSPLQLVLRELSPLANAQGRTFRVRYAATPESRTQVAALGNQKQGAADIDSVAHRHFARFQCAGDRRKHHRFGKPVPCDGQTCACRIAGSHLGRLAGASTSLTSPTNTWMRLVPRSRSLMSV